MGCYCPYDFGFSCFLHIILVWVEGMHWQESHRSERRLGEFVFKYFIRVPSPIPATLDSILHLHSAASPIWYLFSIMVTKDQAHCSWDHLSLCMASILGSVLAKILLFRLLSLHLHDLLLDTTLQALLFCLQRLIVRANGRELKFLHSCSITTFE